MVDLARLDLAALDLHLKQLVLLGGLSVPVDLAGPRDEVAAGRVGPPVVGVAPGLVDTKLTKVTTEHPDRLKGALRAIPLRRTGEPEEIAGGVLFLASPLASYVCGQTIFVDGGLTL